jgi:hypothetical protein
MQKCRLPRNLIHSLLGFDTSFVCLNPFIPEAHVSSPQEATESHGSELSREDAERLIGRMVMEGFLDIELAYTPYATNAYLKLGPMAPRLLEGMRQGTMLM